MEIKIGKGSGYSPVPPKRLEISVERWECPVCKALHGTEYLAGLCCKKYFCTRCHVETGHKFITVCDECKEIVKFEKAARKSVDEWYTDNPGNMVFYDGHYYCSVEDLLDDRVDDPPDHCWGTTRHMVGIDADQILNDIEENSDLEDLEFGKIARSDFRAFAKEWNGKHSEDYFIANEVALIIKENEDIDIYTCSYKETNVLLSTGECSGCPYSTFMYKTEVHEMIEATKLCRYKSERDKGARPK